MERHPGYFSMEGEAKNDYFGLNVKIFIELDLSHSVNLLIITVISMSMKYSARRLTIPNLLAIRKNISIFETICDYFPSLNLEKFMEGGFVCGWRKKRKRTDYSCLKLLMLSGLFQSEGKSCGCSKGSTSSCGASSWLCCADVQ